MPDPLPKLALGATEVHDVFAEPVGDTLRLFIGHCHSANTSPSHTLVVTDGNGFFGTAVDLVRSLQLMRLVPPMLVVGVGYPDAVGLRDTIQIRARDLTHSAGELHPMSGGGERFAEFLNVQLRAWCEQRWPGATEHATFFGHSLGGLFGVNLVLSQPTAPDHHARFQAAIVSSASLWWNDHDTFAAAESLDPDLGLDVHVFAGIGAEETVSGRVRESAALPDSHPIKATEADGLDMVDDLARFIDQLRRREDPSLRLDHVVLDDEFHVSVAPAVLARGLRAVFAPSDVRGR